MSVLSVIVFIGALTAAEKPCSPAVSLEECARQVADRWHDGDAIAAGTAAELLLERASREEGAFLIDGARIAFIAAIGRYVAQSQPAAEYWLWVAARQEGQCGQRLAPPYRQIIDQHAATPGEGRVMDRNLRRSPFLTEPSNCLDVQARRIDLGAATEPDTPSAIVIFGQAQRDRTLSSVGPDEWNTRGLPQFLYEHPAGSVSRSLEALSPGERRALRTSFEGRVLALTPCMSLVTQRSGSIEICRADQPAPASH